MTNQHWGDDGTNNRSRQKLTNLRHHPVAFVRAADVYDPSRIFNVKVTALEDHPTPAMEVVEGVDGNEPELSFFVDNSGNPDVFKTFDMMLAEQRLEGDDDDTEDTGSDLDNGHADDHGPKAESTKLDLLYETSSEESEVEDSLNQNMAQSRHDRDEFSLSDLRALTLRDLDLDIAGDELSAFDADEDDDSDEDQDGGDDGTNYNEDGQDSDSDASVNDEDVALMGINRIVKTRYTADGKEFFIERFDTVLGSEIVLSSTMHEFMDGLGWSLSKRRKYIQRIGGEITEAESYDSMSDDALFDDSEEEETDDNEEIDRVISELIAEADEEMDTGTSKRKNKRKNLVLENYSKSWGATTVRRKNKDPPQFYVSDDELKTYLECQWRKSRKLKAERKKLRAQQLREKHDLIFGPDVLNVAAKYPKHITRRQVVDEIKQFIHFEEQKSLAFPPTHGGGIHLIKQICKTFTALEVATKDLGDDRCVIITKGDACTGQHDHKLLRKFLHKGDHRLQTRTIKKSSYSGRAPRDGAISSAHLKEGEIVGAKAEFINESNIGRLMLQRMGWRVGMSLGATNPGILEPVPAVVKKTRWGIGVT